MPGKLRTASRRGARTAVALGVLAAALLAGRALAAAGQLDPSFSGDGRQLTSFPGAIGDGTVHGVAIDQNGKIVAAGFSAQAGGYRFAVARYNPNGSLDHGFSGDGRQLTRFPGAAGLDVGQAVAIDQNGKIVVAGT